MAELRREREQRGWTKLRAVTQLQTAARERGIVLSAQRDSLLRQLARWENGEKPSGWTGPDEPYRTLFCSIYGKTPEEFGWAHSSGSQESASVTAALNFDPSTKASLAALGDLSKVDANPHDTAMPGVNNFASERLSALALDWMFVEPIADLPTHRSIRVTPADVHEIRQTTRTLDQLDRQVGGEQSRVVAARYLNQRVLPRLAGQYTLEVERDLFHAAAVLCEVIGWNALDMGRPGISQRYFTQALRLAKTGGHRHFGAYVLTSLSDQALFLGHPREALRLAQAAHASATGAPSVLTESALLEARAHATLQDQSGCAAALNRAERAFDKIRPEDVEDRHQVIDNVILASHVGTCWVDLGEPNRAETSLVTVLDAMRGQARRRVYGTIQLAKVALLRKDTELACSLGIEAAGAINGLPSYRSAHHLNDLAQRVRTVGPHPRSSDFLSLADATLSGPRPLTAFPIQASCRRPDQLDTVKP
jgi:hypothetical protein